MASNESQTLYIPQGLKTRVEIFDGYGKEELIKTIMVTLCGGVIDGISFMIFRNVVFSVVFMLVIVSGSIMMLTKDKNNISVVDQIGFMLNYTRSQKVYRYKYMEEWKW